MNASDLPDETLFEGALKCRTPHERAAYLDQACAGQPELRRKLEVLLQAHDRSGEFLEPAAAALRPTVKLDLAPEEAVGTVIGRYKLLQKIGEGGMGVVYMAEQTEPVIRKVALKIIKLGMDTHQVVARFEAERQALALMDHPNIAKVLDAGATAAGRPYFVMELVRGVAITEYCDKNKLSTRQRLDLFIPVCQAIQHAHQKGIIHRDIKPSNVMVTLHDGQPVPRVIDFGVAKATSQRLTEKTLFTHYAQMIGTPAYMSPEQAEMSGLDIDTRTDLYSLGVLLYELLTGTTPFNAKELLSKGYAEMQRIIAQQEPPKPSTRMSTMQNEERTVVATNHSMPVSALSKALQGDLDWIVMKCLEKDRARRYDTANGLAADLARHLNDEPVVARPPSRLYEFQKLVRRHKFGFAAAAAIVLVLAGGLTLATWQAVRAARAERQEKAARFEAEKARQNEAGLRQTAQTEADRAEASGMEAKRTLSAADFLQAARLIAEDNANDALPFLARSVSVNPSNSAALTRLTTLLTYRSWMLPALILKHGKPVNSAEFSPDSEQIFTISADGTARGWNANTGSPLAEPVKRPSQVAATQLSRDGKRKVVVSSNTVLVADAQTGQPLTPPMMHGTVVIEAQFSPDEGRILTTADDATARVWNALTGEPLTPPMKHPVIDVIEPAGSKRKTTYSQNIVGVKIAGGTLAYSNRPALTMPNVRIHSQFSPDGHRIATVGFRTALVWDAQTGELQTEPMKHGDEVVSAQFSPDGKRVVTASADKTARVWDAQTGQPLSEPLVHGGRVASARFSPDGTRVVTASDDETACIWEARTGQPSPLIHLDYYSQYSRPQFSPEGRRIVAPSIDNTARVWDAQTGQTLGETKKHGDQVTSTQFSPDGQRIVTASKNNTARVWDALTGRALTEPMMHGDKVVWAQFSPDGRHILTASRDKTARVWDAQTGQPITEPITHGEAVLSAQFSPDGKQIVTASDDNTARVWDSETGQPLTKPKKRGAVTAAQFSPDGKSFVTASDKHNARVWDARSGEQLTENFKHGNQVNSAQFSPDGKRIVTSSHDNTARVWDAQTGQPLTEPMKHGKEVLSAQFSPDGKRIVTASSDWTARVWDAHTGLPLTEPMKHRWEVSSAQFSPDGKRILTVAGNTTRMWDVAPTGEYPNWLLQLSEAISGKVLNPEGVLEPTRLNRVETLNQLRQKLAALPDDDWVMWGRWLLADRATRTISPFAKVTVPEYIERLIKEKTRQSLDEAEPLAAGKPEILERISAARETLKQPK